MEPEEVETAESLPWGPRRVNNALRKRHNWEELFKFCVVGASGYVVNLAVYALLVRLADVHYIPAAIGSFVVAVTNNYTWNRLWTFPHRRGHVAYQGLRCLVVALVTLGANIAILRLLVEAGVGKIPAQAVAIVLVTPLNFIGNKLWSFRRQ
jgi:dolichol-phosphate mannosyltransferase